MVVLLSLGFHPISGHVVPQFVEVLLLLAVVVDGLVGESLDVHIVLRPQEEVVLEQVVFEQP